MSDGGAFLLVLFGVLCLLLFLGGLYSKWAVEIREPRREAEWNQSMRSTFGQNFQPEPMKRHVTQSRGAKTFRYRDPDWNEMARRAKS